jgi:hypothetical protein
VWPFDIAIVSLRRKPLEVDTARKWRFLLKRGRFLQPPLFSFYGADDLENFIHAPRVKKHTSIVAFLEGAKH